MLDKDCGTISGYYSDSGSKGNKVPDGDDLSEWLILDFSSQVGSCSQLVLMGERMISVTVIDIVETNNITIKTGKKFKLTHVTCSGEVGLIAGCTIRKYEHIN